MRISLIAAVAHNYVIGKDKDLPWHLPSDLKWFKSQTLGKPVILGRRTFESMGGALPGRDNIVLTTREGYEAPGATVVHSVEEALAEADTHDVDEAMILGGSAVYEEFMPRADRFYLTVVHEEFEGDTFFPAIDLSQWRVVSTEHRDSDERNPHAHTFYVLDRLEYAEVTKEADLLPEALRRA